MAVSPSFRAYVLEQLDGVRQVTDRRMFGGIGLYAAEVFFGVLDNDTLFFKVNDETRPRYEQHGMPPFAPMPGQAPMRGYYQVPASVLEDAGQLTSWATEAIAVGATAPAKKRTKRSRA